MNSRFTKVGDRASPPSAGVLPPVELRTVTGEPSPSGQIDIRERTAVMKAPLSPTRLDSGLRHQSRGRHRSSIHKRHLLLIDDDEDILDALRLGLESKGYDVETAPNGYRGLEMLRRGPRFDFVISDVGMPGMDGWEIARQISANLPGTKVLLLTGWAREIPKSEPRRRLVMEVLPKPASLDRIDRILTQSV